MGWSIEGANHNDVKLLVPTLTDVARVGPLADIETLHLDGGYDYPKVRTQLAALGFSMSSASMIASSKTMRGRRFR